MILDVLTGCERLSLEEIVEKINEKSSECFEPQTVRNKLKEYIEYGIVNVKKEKNHIFILLAGVLLKIPEFLRMPLFILVKLLHLELLEVILPIG